MNKVNRDLLEQYIINPMINSVWNIDLIIDQAIFEEGYEEKHHNR